MSSLNTRQPSPQEKAIIDDVLELYKCNPSDKAYSHYAPAAIFHDPVSIAKGKESIMSQFNGMPKIFKESTTKQCDILEGPPDSIILNLTQHYVFKGNHTPEKTVNSKVTLKMKGGMIEHHEEEWDHKHNKDGSDGFMGKLQELRKEFSAKVVEKAVSSDPSKV